jgi:RNA polymerase primary sigma factor
LSTKSEVLLADEAPIWEMEDLRQLVADGQERGFLTFEQIAAALEEVEVTKEQVQELHHHLDEQRPPPRRARSPAARRPRSRRST